MKRWSAPLAALILTAGLLVGMPSAGAVSDPVDIRVEHDLPADPGTDGPRVLEVTGVTVDAGPEITVADETENPSNWNGNVLVDIDPDAQTITVEVEDQDCYGSTLVLITTDEIDSVSTVSDEIYVPGSDITLTTDVSGGVVTLSWLHGDESTCPGYDVEGSQSVFSYELAAQMTVDPTNATVGETVTVSGTGCEGDEVDVVVSLDGSEVATGTAAVEADGTWSLPVDTTDLDPGSYDVAATCSILDDPVLEYPDSGFVLSEPVPEPQPEPEPAQPAAPAAPAAPTVVNPTFTG